jgi:hypothetical protein
LLGRDGCPEDQSPDDNWKSHTAELLQHGVCLSPTTYS